MTTTPAPQAPPPPPAPIVTPPSASGIAGDMIGGALKSLPAKIAGGVIAALVVVAMILAGVSDGPGAALGALIAAVFILFGIAFVIAIPTGIVVLIIASGRARRAESGIMATYAASRGLSYSPSASLPTATPLLSAGTRRETEDLMSGRLSGGLEGSLAHYTFTVTSGSGKNRHSTPYPNTVVLTQLPETTAYVRRLLCQGGGPLGRKALFGLDFSGDREVALESTVMNERYKLKTSPDQDEAWLRELFTPRFVDWLAHRARPNFSFELVDGLLVVSVADRLGRSDDLDWLCEAATYVAGRIRGEVLEDSAAPISS